MTRQILMRLQNTANQRHLLMILYVRLRPDVFFSRCLCSFASSVFLQNVASCKELPCVPEVMPLKDQGEAARLNIEKQQMVLVLGVGLGC